MDIAKLADECDKGVEAADAFREKLLAAAEGEAAKQKAIGEYIGIFRELRDREGYEVLFQKVCFCKFVPSQYLRSSVLIFLILYFQR